jgi:putative DNA primase/helicase
MPRDETAVFLDRVFGNKPEDTFILIWTSPSKVSYWCADVDTAAKTASSIAACGAENVYCGVGLSRRRFGRHERCKAADIAGIVGYWADIDIAGPGHAKPNLPPDRESAEAILERIGPRPSVVVHSGHGLQAWWLFREPWMFDTAEERGEAAIKARHWAWTIRTHARALGFDADSVGDLPRVLRVPGTLNYKVADHPTVVRLVRPE